MSAAVGLYDDYSPDPPLSCPVCGAALEGWQGHEGPCLLLVWKQGVAAPVEQLADEENRFPPEELAELRLPERFFIHAWCCSRDFAVEAECQAPGGTWSRTELVTAETLRQGKTERRTTFKARLRWLSGKGG